jgi:hypothetical protein
MSPAQNAKYWREWSRVRAADPGADRHELHRQALGGKDKSHRKFSNPDFDQVLAAFSAVHSPDNLAMQVALQNQPRKRALHTIRTFPAEYVKSLCLDRFGTSNLDHLTNDQVFLLAMTLDNRRESIEDREIRREEAIGESLDSEEGCAEGEELPHEPAVVEMAPRTRSDQ